MKVYIFFKHDEDSDNDIIFAVMNNPNLEKFKERYPNENSFYIEEHELEEVEKTNTHDLNYFCIIFEPNEKMSFAKYPKHSKYDFNNLKIKEIQMVEKDYTYQSPQIFMQYIDRIHHYGVYIFAIDEEHARHEATELMRKFLEENHDED